MIAHKKGNYSLQYPLNKTHIAAAADHKKPSKQGRHADLSPGKIEHISKRTAVLSVGCRGWWPAGPAGAATSHRHDTITIQSCCHHNTVMLPSSYRHATIAIQSCCHHNTVMLPSSYSHADAASFQLPLTCTTPGSPTLNTSLSLPSQVLPRPAIATCC